MIPDLYHLFSVACASASGYASRGSRVAPTFFPPPTSIVDTIGRGTHALFETAEQSEAVSDRFGVKRFGSVRTRTIGFVATLPSAIVEHTRGQHSAKPHISNERASNARVNPERKGGDHRSPLPPSTTAAAFESTLPVAPASCSAARANPEQKGGDHRLRTGPAEVIPQGMIQRAEEPASAQSGYGPGFVCPVLTLHRVIYCDPGSVSPMHS